MEKYDLVVIGSGPAGFGACMKAVDQHKKVCLVEGAHIGGAGIMNGALTSKTMWELSRDYDVTSKVTRGYRVSGLQVDFSEVKKIILQAAKAKQYQILSQIETYAYSDGKEGSITLKRGWAKFIDKNTIEITKDKEKELVSAKNFIIATGSVPKKLHGINIDQKRILTSDGILNLTSFPERMIIIGSGIIGCEFATIFSNFKQTEVHLLDRANRVIPFEDEDISLFVSDNLSKNGVIIHHDASLKTIRKHRDYLEVVLDYKNGNCEVLEVDVALIAIGRIPNTTNLGLENIDIQPTKGGFLDINQYCMISDNPLKCQFFAAGDITGNGQLYSIAEHQGRYATEGIFKNAIYQPDYSIMPTLMFFKPLLASVGMNEKTLRRKKIPYRVVYYSNELVNRTIAMRSTIGFVKIMVSNDSDKKILGMRAAGPQASAFIVSVAHLINHGNSISEVLEVVNPHPSVTEGIQDALRALEGESVFKPKSFPKLIKVSSWKPK